MAITAAPGAITAAARLTGVSPAYWLITPAPAATVTSTAVPMNSTITRIHSGRSLSVSSSNWTR